MKQEKENTLVLGLAVLYLFFIFATKGCSDGTDREKEWLEWASTFTPKVQEGVEENLDDEWWDYHYVTVTHYNPTPEQCDSDYLTTADNSKINLTKLKRGELKWVAVSRDLFKKGFKYGDVIELKKGNSRINGYYVIHDTMHPRFTGRVDILTSVGEPMGKWTAVAVRLVNRGGE